MITPDKPASFSVKYLREPHYQQIGSMENINKTIPLQSKSIYNKTEPKIYKLSFYKKTINETLLEKIHPQ